MSATLSKSYGFSSAAKVEAEDLVGKKQGIVSILGSDTKPASLRRTLSADMSSKKWMSQNGVFPMKKIASSKEFPVDSSSSEEDESNPDQCDIWNLIISQKSKEENSESLPPPYIHPLVKRSSSLSEKSLEICTESLGSETGSDGFSWYPQSETGDADADDNRECPKQGQSLSSDEEETRFVKNNYVNCGGRRSGRPRSFPPPIPTLALNDGASVMMKTHRDNGRLVMEAVSVPSQNNFRAQRHDGRLVLTFANPPAALDDEADEKSEETDEKASVEEMGFEFDSFENDEDEEKEEEETESEDDFEIEDEEEESFKAKDSNFTNKLPALFNYKPKPSTITFTNRSPTWPNRFNKIVKVEDKLDEEKPAEPTIPLLAQSLPPRPKPARMIPAPPATAAAAAGSYNAYEYYWRPKPIEKSSGLNCDEEHPQSLKSTHNNNLGLSKCHLRGQQKGDNLVVPLLNSSCKQEPRRSLLFWEPHCIATS